MPWTDDSSEAEVPDAKPDRYAAAAAAQQAWAAAAEALAHEEFAVGAGVAVRDPDQCLGEEPALDGVRGVVLRFRPDLDRFEVRTETHGDVAVPAEFLAAEEGRDAWAGKRDAAALLRPGAVFDGTIAIPGLTAASARETYRVFVVGLERGAGGDVLVGRHSAYGDEQVCDLALSDATLRYADGETACVGEVDPARGEIRGGVSQLVWGEDGHYHPSEAVTHTFEVRVRPESDAATALRARLLAASEARCEAWATYGCALRAEGLGEADEAALRRVRWLEVFEEAVILGEAECCRFRRHSTRLDQLTFETAEAKAAALQAVADEGVTRASAHAAQDASRDRLRGILSILARLDQPPGRLQLLELGPGAGAGAWQDAVRIGLQKVQVRLLQSFQRLDAALRAAEVRLPVSALAPWRLGAAGAEGDCPICYCALADGEGPDDTVPKPDGPPLASTGPEARPGVLALPCGHRFHEPCLRTWLHRNASCPYCRADLGAKTSGAPDETGSA